MAKYLLINEKVLNKNDLDVDDIVLGSPDAIKEKLNKWMVSNPEYTPEQIYKAADLYLSKEGSNIKYLQRADYFVYKTENGITNSRLSAYIDEIDDFEEDGWTNELR